jgi:proteasome inhibitor subunit 1 (PI31)
MAPDLLDPSALIATLPSLLPGEGKTLDSPQDAIAALLHTALIAVSFRLIGVDESTQSPLSVSDNILPAGWNKHGPGYYTLIYKHDQSSLEFLIKLTKLGKRTVINAIALQVGDHLFVSSTSILRFT